MCDVATGKNHLCRFMLEVKGQRLTLINHIVTLGVIVI